MIKNLKFDTFLNYYSKFATRINNQKVVNLHKLICDARKNKTSKTRKKGKPFYWIVAADSRSKEMVVILEKLGIYNPNTNPATVELDIEGAVKWLQNGAQPSDTARTLLSYKGAMIKHHLNGGVRKGAFTQEEADKKLTAWLEEKQAKIQAKIDSLDKDKARDLAIRLESEKAVNQKRIADLLAKPEVQENEGEGPESAVVETTETANEEASKVDDNATEGSFQ